MNCVLFAKMDQVFSKEHKTLKNTGKLEKKYWKSQGILSVRKSGNPEYTMLYGHCYYCRNKAWVVFFAPTVALVRQQYQEFRKWFSGQKVDYLVGAETDDKTDVEVMIEFNEVKKKFPVFNPNNSTFCGKIVGKNFVTVKRLSWQKYYLQ